MNLPLNRDELFAELPLSELEKMFPHMTPKEIRARRQTLARRRHAMTFRNKHTRTTGDKFGQRAAGIYYEGHIIPPTEPVYRDPCPRCGVRGDVPCGHSKVRLGMVL